MAWWLGMIGFPSASDWSGPATPTGALRSTAPLTPTAQPRSTGVPPNGRTYARPAIKVGLPTQSVRVSTPAHSVFTSMARPALGWSRLSEFEYRLTSVPWPIGAPQRWPAGTDTRTPLLP